MTIHKIITDVTMNINVMTLYLLNLKSFKHKSEAPLRKLRSVPAEIFGVQGSSSFIAIFGTLFGSTLIQIVLLHG